MKKTNKAIFFLIISLVFILPAGFACKSSDETPTSPTVLQSGDNTTLQVVANVDSSSSVGIDGSTIFTQDVNAPISTLNNDIRLELGTHTLETLCINADTTFSCTFTISLTARFGDTTYTPSSFSLTQAPADGTVSNSFVVSLTVASL